MSQRYGFASLSLTSSERSSVWVNGNWRVTFEFEGENAIIVDYEDYH
ncbi:type II toxin-antitoxin system RelE/ParE family toxin [Leptospira venezuelensis]|nr:type II toxin-antitoxin system RelE/ParE family toxin [Leptospira venezuelensis]